MASETNHDGILAKNKNFVLKLRLVGLGGENGERGQGEQGCIKAHDDTNKISVLCHVEFH